MEEEEDQPELYPEVTPGMFEPLLEEVLELDFPQKIELSHQPEPRLAVYIPLVIVSNILSRLKIKDIFRFRSVCKAWSELPMDSNFVEMKRCRAVEEPYQLLFPRGDFSWENFDPDNICLVTSGKSEWKCKKVRIGGIQALKNMNPKPKGCCNGMLCMTPSKGVNPMFIYNPITKAHMQLPKLCRRFSGKRLCGGIGFGFGFDQGKKKYKVVVVYNQKFLGEGNIYDFVTKGEIITVGESSWRLLNFPYRITSRGSSAKPVYLNGAFHWLIHRETEYCDLDRMILALDISDETFKVIQFPSSNRTDLAIKAVSFQSIQSSTFVQLPIDLKLKNMGESLALVRKENSVGLEIWQIVSRESNGRHLQNFRFCAPGKVLPGKVLGMLSNGNFVCETFKGFVGRPSLYRLAAYDSEYNERVFVKETGIRFRCVAFSFVPSCVFPSAI